jgi:putative membrane protein
MGWHDMNGTDWIWATTMMVLFWGVVAAVVVALMRRSGTTGSAPRDTSEVTLRQRLARGEIDIDEYHERIEALHSPTEQ